MREQRDVAEGHADLGSVGFKGLKKLVTDDSDVLCQLA